MAYSGAAVAAVVAVAFAGSQTAGMQRRWYRHPFAWGMLLTVMAVALDTVFAWTVVHWQPPE